MTQDEIIKIATDVYNSLGTQYGVAKIPAHVHNGVDANRIDIKDVITAHSNVALGTTGAITLNPGQGTVFTITPTAATQITPTSFPLSSEIFVIVKTSGTTSYTITFDVGFTANGTLATGTVNGVYFVVHFISDGINFREVSRTVAMLPS